MNKLRIVGWVVVVAVVLGVVWGYGVPRDVQYRVGDAVREQGHAVLLGVGPEKEAYNSFGPIELRTKPMAKTQVPGENLSFSFTFKHAMWPGMSGLNDYVFDELTLTTPLNYFRITGAPVSGQYHWIVTGALPDTYTLVVDPPVSEEDIYWIEIPCSVEMTGQSATKLTSSSSPIGEKGATHAKEMILTEEWFIPAGTAYTVTIGDQTFEHVTDADQTTALSVSLLGNGLDCDDWSDYMVGTKYAMSIEGITFGPVDIDTSSFTAVTWGGTAASVDKLWVEGFGGNSIGFWCSASFYNGAYVYNTYTGGAISAPYCYNFAGCSFLWMDGTAVDTNLQVYCTGLRNLNASGIDVGDWHGTIAELKAQTWTQVHGCYYWDTWDPDMQSTVELYLDLTSAEALGIEIRGPQPAFAVEAAGYSGGTEWTLGYVSPVDGQYKKYMPYNGDWMYTNGQFYMYLIAEGGDDWGIGPGPPIPPYYIQEGGGPSGVYLVNDAAWDDDIIFPATGQRRFSGLAGAGMGPACSANTSEAILVDSDCASPSWQHDATFIFDLWSLDKTSRTESPYNTDIVNLSADGPKYIYADAHDHTDWAITNGTGPDIDGYFTINAGGGTIKFYPKCNYRTRQAEAKGIGNPNAIAVPTCYRDRRANTHIGEGTVPETAEAIWDWRARYLTQLFKDLPLPYDVTVTIEYYMDLLGVGDNHDTDNSRQTDYTYSAGPLYTITRTIPVSYADVNGWSTILVDLYDEANGGQPVAMGYSLQWALPAGTYRMNPPYLTLDLGDRNEIYPIPPYNYRQAPAYTGLEFKVDESSTYSQGQVSLHYNGFAYMALFIPDNAKPCRLERCFDTLNVVYGEVGDFTSVYTLAGWPITNSGDAFLWSYSAATEAVHMTDEDGATLKVLSVADIAPDMHLGEVGNVIYPRVAVRAFRYEAPNGLPIHFRGTKYVGGQAHGMVVTKAADTGTGEPFPRKRGGLTGKLYRRHLGSEDEQDYLLVSTGFGPDAHSHWTSGAHTTFNKDDAERPMYEYAILQSGEYRSLGRFATREYALGQVFVVGGREIYVTDQSENLVFVFEHDSSDGIQVIYTSDAGQWYRDGISLAPYANPKTVVAAANTDGCPAAYTTPRGDLYLYHLKDNALHRLISSNWGVTWGSDETVIPSTENLEKSVEFEYEGRQYTYGVDSSGNLNCYTSNTHFDEDTYTLGSNKALIVAGADTETHPGFYRAHGKLYAYTYVGSDRRCYRSDDFGKTWAEETA